MERHPFYGKNPAEPFNDTTVCINWMNFGRRVEIRERLGEMIVETSILHVRIFPGQLDGPQGWRERVFEGPATRENMAMVFNWLLLAHPDD